jgi:hypothetical protein
MPQNQHYSDGAHVFVIYPADCVPPASTDDRDVLLVEDTENAARCADVCGAIYRYTFKDGVADDEQFVGLTRQHEEHA